MDRNRNSNKFNIFNARSMSGHGLLTNELRVLWDFLGHRGPGMLVSLGRKSLSSRLVSRVVSGKNFKSPFLSLPN